MQPAPPSWAAHPSSVVSGTLAHFESQPVAANARTASKHPKRTTQSCRKSTSCSTH